MAHISTIKGRRRDMEEVPLHDVVAAANPAHYRELMSRAIAQATEGIASLDWKVVDDETAADGLQLCTREEDVDGLGGIRIMGRLRGGLQYWRALWSTGVNITYDSYVYPEEQGSRLFVFAHTVDRHRAAGIYFMRDVRSERAVQFVYVTDDSIHALHTDPMQLPHLDGTLSVWFRTPDGEDDHVEACELHLVAWPNFYNANRLSTWIESLRTWTTLDTRLGIQLRKALISMQPASSSQGSQ